MNLAHILETGRHDAPALVADGVTWTYADVRGAVAVLARDLAGRGLAPGDRVGLLAANTPAFVVGAFAALSAGLAVVPCNPQSPTPELRRELERTGVRLALVDTTPAAARHDPGALGTALLVVDPAPVPAAAPAEIVERDADAPAFLLHTSGTAGPPAAAVLTHANLLANLAQVAAHPGAALTPSDVVLGVAPLCHVFGLNAVLHPALAAGACVVLVPDFDAAATLALLDARRVSIVSGPPALWDALATACEDPTVFGQVRLALSGAAPLDARTVGRVAERCGVDLQQGYGLTEAAPVVTLAVATDAPASSVGVPLPGVEVRLVDEVGRDVLVGDEGEVWVRGANVFAGYWDDPDATARALTRDGWLRTGDIAVVDDHGFVTLVDRIKDCIIVSGFNVHPAEVEAILLEDPAVAAAVVVGVPSARTGERVEATVVPAAGATVDVDALVARCRGALARYKVPTAVHVAASVPRGVTGKALRRKLRPPADS